MPNRIIRGDLLDSDRYNSLTHDSERLLFIELLLLADDYGLVPVNFGFLRRRTTPCVAKSLEQVTQMVSALADADLIRCYQSDRGGQYAFIPRFDNRPQALKPKWPVPPDHVTQGAIESAQANSKGLYRKQTLAPNATATHSYVAPETETETEELLKHAPPSEECRPESGRAYQVPNCPYSELIAFYHRYLPANPRVEVLTDQRKRHMQARWRHVCADGRLDREAGLEWFESYFRKAATHPFLVGRKPPAPGRRPFFASIDFLMNAERFVNVYEGKYAEA